jgi:opacity protein-like surface antigen
MTRCRTLALASALALIPAPLAAQEQSLGVSGFGGLFLPVADLASEALAGETFQLGLSAGWAIGGRASLWLSSRFALEVEAAYAASDLEIVNTPVDTSFSARLVLGSVNVLYSLYDPPFQPISVHASAGLGLVSHGGNAFDLFESTTDVAVALGVGVRYGIARGWYIRADVRDYISLFAEEGVPGADSSLQSDLLFAAGVELNLSGF